MLMLYPMVISRIVVIDHLTRNPDVCDVYERVFRLRFNASLSNPGPGGSTLLLALLRRRHGAGRRLEA
jgi:hypothetical protein